MRATRLAALFTAALLLLAACTPASGTVVSRRQVGSGLYEVCVKAPDGKTGCDSAVAADVYIACTVGKTWPTCKPLH